MPIVSGVLHQTAERLTDYENYETNGAYKEALTHKSFIMDLVTSYLGITLTAFVYVPFARIIVPYLDVFSLTVKAFAEHHDQLHVEPDRFNINRNRLRNQLIYFTVTAQVVNFLLELVVPYVMRRGASTVKQLQTEYSLNHGGAGPSVADMDDESEAPFLARVRKEVKLAKYDVFVDIREMVIQVRLFISVSLLLIDQFGYLALFSVVWPLTSVCFLVNNWIELRADAIKIVVGMQRPLPIRADSIGPWLESLGFLAWLGTLTTAALTYMFGGDEDSAPDGTPKGIQGWALLLTVFTAEQSFLVVRWMVRAVISTLESPERTANRRRTYMLRRRFVEESLKGLPAPATRVKTEESAKVDLKTLEEQARKQAAGDGVEPFWARQQGWREVVKAGGSIMERLAEGESKKEK
jgi:anoctamin-10